jgi:3-oxoacyl-[acyl-carrier protein] reductase
METGLKNRVAIVAASSQGIGKATALSFAAEGAHVALCARQAGPLDAVAREVSDRYGVKAYAAAFDVSDDTAVRGFVKSTYEHFGRVDVCVTNAGGPPAKPFLATTMDEWERAWQLNLRSIVSFAQAVLPYMQQQKWGRIVTLTSYTVKQPVPELVLSNSIRAGVMGLLRSLAGQFGPDGITVNNVGPGFTSTARSAELLEKRAANRGMSVEKIKQEMLQEIPVRRMATPEEVAAAIVWLASEQAACITGQTLLVDGGAYRGL